MQQEMKTFELRFAFFYLSTCFSKHCYGIRLEIPGHIQVYSVLKITEEILILEASKSRAEGGRGSTLCQTDRASYPSIPAETVLQRTNWNFKCV